MGEISTKDLLYMINKILISDCPITCDDLKVANDIFGTRIKALKSRHYGNQESVSNWI